MLNHHHNKVSGTECSCGWEAKIHDENKILSNRKYKRSEMDSQVDDTALLLASMSLLIFFNPYVMDLGVHTLQSSYIEALTQNLMV